MRNLAFFMALMTGLFSACKAGDTGLDAIHADILSKYDTVAQLSAEDYLALDKSKVLLLDIREPEEYAVSRIPGAIWVSPQAGAQSAVIQIGDVTDKNIIVYCSVGHRSSDFASRVQSKFLNNGAASVANLERGIFGWHNEKRALVDAKGKTDAVHPYDNIWKRYVERAEMVRFVPIAE